MPAGPARRAAHHPRRGLLPLPPFDYVDVYFGGACLLARIQHRIGRARFRSALRDYAVAHRYGWSTAAEFRAAMDAAAGSTSLADLWRAFRVR